MKKAPRGSYNQLSFKGIAMRKNIYKHFFTFDNGFKNGDGNKLYTGDYTENCTGIILSGNQYSHNNSRKKFTQY
jgi:hypothetical protein